MWSPLQIQVLLHCHATREPFPRMHAPAVKDAYERFIMAGLIEPIQPKEGDTEVIYKTTERGSALVELICKTPLPVVLWVDPRTKEVI